MADLPEADASTPISPPDSSEASAAEPSALRVVLRYAAFQLPELAVVGCILAVAHEWEVLSTGAAKLFLLLWVVKDVVMFPIVRGAYAPRQGPSPHDPHGSVGVAPEGLDGGEAYVRIGAERWRARRAPGSSPIQAGAAIRVLGLDGLTLIVESFVDAERGASGEGAEG